MSFSKKPKTINLDEVDPSVFYYDEVYDDMKKEEQNDDRRDTEKRNTCKPSGSLYIKGLQETADIRKTEKELRRFKKYARDNEKTPDIGEEVYLTAGYKRKLEEMKLLEDDKRRRLEEERDNSMNFLKKCYSDKDKNAKERFNKNCDILQPMSSKLSTEYSEAKVDNNGTNTEIIGPQPIRPKRELKTFKERKDYLRKVLAKRTIGKVLEGAVQRYRERKTSSSC